MKLGIFVGRVGGDAELTYTPTGIAVAKFSIAIDNGKDKEGEKKNATWVKATIWRERAEKLAPHIKKGNMVAVAGDIEVRAWNDKNSGEARCSLEVTVDKFDFAGSSAKGNSDEQQAPAARPQAAQQNDGPIDDSDIPF